MPILQLDPFYSGGLYAGHCTTLDTNVLTRADESVAHAWTRAAASYEADNQHNPYEYDVFISHAGKGADKPFARVLKKLLERTGWHAPERVFLDDESLLATCNPEECMERAIEQTHVAVLLFSAEFFERPATKHELKVLMGRYAQHCVQLLPVFLHLTVEECKQKVCSLLGEGV